MSGHAPPSAGAGGMTLAQLQQLERAWVVPSYARLPVELVRGEGSWVWDERGDAYLDFVCGVGVTSLGHCHPRVVEAVRAQVGRLMHTSNLFYTEPAMLLAERLSRSSLGGKVYFANSGAEANEAAIKLARKAKPGGDVVSVYGAFHGRTYGALSATPQESKQAPFAPLVPGFRAVAPEPEALAAAIDERTAAVIVEPIQGETGVNVLPEGVLARAREACTAHDAVLVFDEVQCGMGRTGTLWAYEQTGVTPDALTSAKALAGGLPMGALVLAPGLGDVLSPGEHGSTFAGGPVVAAAALAALEVTSDPALLARARERGQRLAAGLAGLPHVREVRGRGLILACELDVSAPEVVRRALLEQRLIVNATGPTTVRLLPPLTLSPEELDEGLARLARALSADSARSADSALGG
jgi:acetylornithine/N-succinyldiaminopimelate aminotransferase